MRTFFSSHGPDARNGGTSYLGYIKWVRDGMPNMYQGSHYEGAVSG